MKNNEVIIDAKFNKNPINEDETDENALKCKNIF